MLTFGGDLFSPSMLSTATRGKHMTRIMNQLGVHYSVIGNFIRSCSNTLRQSRSRLWRTTFGQTYETHT
jgi:hypothetical protein